VVLALLNKWGFITEGSRLVVFAFSPSQSEHPPETWLHVPVTMDGENEFTWGRDDLLWPILHAVAAGTR